MKLDLKIYRGYVNDNQLIVFGHVFESWAPDHYRIDRKGIRHAVSIIHMFRIKPLKNVSVTLIFQGMEVTTKTLEDGFFSFNLPFSKELEPGWHPFSVVCKIYDFGIIECGELLKPNPGQLGIISDIDDTFLVSHSKKFFKKLYILLLKNINKRKLFEDVVPHYRALSKAGQDSKEASNSFFYVSSSEWNLYEFIDSFIRLHDLPKGILKLKDIRSGISDFLFSGKGNHDHKFEKIKEILNFYPAQNYVLLGDDSQRDSYLYERIVKQFTQDIIAVYIRQTGRRKIERVKDVMKNLNVLGVSTCYFKESSQAIAHSRSIGIIK